jgi:hypothetical protein
MKAKASSCKALIMLSGVMAVKLAVCRLSTLYAGENRHMLRNPARVGEA